MRDDCSIALEPVATSSQSPSSPGAAQVKEDRMAVVHTSRLRLERIAGPLRHAYLEGFDEPIRFGVHGGIKAFYGIEPEEDVPATLDYIVGAVGG